MHNQITNSRRRHVLVALGSNVAGAWGTPSETLETAIAILGRVGVSVNRVSRFYTSSPLGGGAQDAYVNAVAAIETSLPPASLLFIFKRLERCSGRRLGRHWGPRTLDLDILSAGATIGRRTRGRRPAGRVVLPHPELHRRIFVLAPLAEIAPHWWHPVEQKTVIQLLRSPMIQRQRSGIKLLRST